MPSSRSILIVEDEPLIAMMLEDFIISLGHDVSGNCDSVVSALAEVEKGQFDLAILELRHITGRNLQDGGSLTDIQSDALAVRSQFRSKFRCHA